MPLPPMGKAQSSFPSGTLRSRCLWFAATYSVGSVSGPISFFSGGEAEIQYTILYKCHTSHEKDTFARRNGTIRNAANQAGVRSLTVLCTQDRMQCNSHETGTKDSKFSFTSRCKIVVCFLVLQELFHVAFGIVYSL